VTIYEALDRAEREQQLADTIEVAADATPLQFLQAVYRSPNQPMQRRLKAAIEAAEFVHPRLAVTAMLGGGFATQLERALQRSGKLIEHQPTIETKPQPKPKPEPAPGPIDPPPHLGPSSDRRFRR
jgi:hypothetical protein